MKNSLSKVQFCYFRLSCRIKNLYQMAKKAADKCKYLAKYIYVKNSLRRNMGRGSKKVPAPATFLGHGTLGISSNEGLWAPVIKWRAALTQLCVCKLF